MAAANWRMCRLRQCRGDFCQTKTRAGLNRSATMEIRVSRVYMCPMRGYTCVFGDRSMNRFRGTSTLSGIYLLCIASQDELWPVHVHVLHFLPLPLLLCPAVFAFLKNRLPRGGGLIYLFIWNGCHPFAAASARCNWIIFVERLIRFLRGTMASHFLEPFVPRC